MFDAKHTYTQKANNWDSTYSCLEQASIDTPAKDVDCSSWWQLDLEGKFRHYWVLKDQHNKHKMTSLDISYHNKILILHFCHSDSQISLQNTVSML